MKLCALISAAIILVSCDGPTEKQGDGLLSKSQMPLETRKAIEKEFPGAKPYSVAIDSILRILTSFGIQANQILWGQSTCVDDITNTKNKSVHPEIKGPFTMGGLGGIPFTGVTGVNAFSHHVPEDGTALIFVAPHIGINEKEGWGKIQRHGQKHASSCCGALVGALKELQNGNIKAEIPNEDDYQEQVIGQLAYAHKDEILNAKEPLVALTRVAFVEAQTRVTRFVKQAKERHFPYAVVVTGVIINTDYSYDDYLWLQRVAVKDIKKDSWVKE